MPRFLTLLCLLTLCPPLFADDPVTPPVPEVHQLTVGKDVSGTGLRKDPFVFTTVTKPVIRLTGRKLESVTWETSDAPSDFEILGDVGVFSLSEPGSYVVYVRGDQWHTKCWFVIKTTTDPPIPPKPVDVLAGELRTALIGATATKDASKLQGMTSTLADALQAGQFATHGEAQAAWKTLQTANQWPTGTYPKMPDVMRLAIPTVEAKTPLATAERAAIVANLRILEKTAEAIANGK